MFSRRSLLTHYWLILWLLAVIAPSEQLMLSWHAKALLDEGVHVGSDEGTGIPMTSSVMLGKLVAFPL